MSNMITVGISDLNIAKSPDILVTYALGSCVGICLYDATIKLAGLSHIMLPSSTLTPGSQGSYKFADTAIVELLKKMEARGAHSIRIKAKIAGGAQMFAAITNSSIANVGQRNIVAVKETLAKLHIPIIAEDVGSNYGRTVYFHAETGIMHIKSATRGEWTF